MALYLHKIGNVLTLWLLMIAGLQADEQSWKYEDAIVGQLPPHWTAAKTGEGPGSVWKVAADPSSPAGKKVLAQSSAEGLNRLFNLCVADDSRFGDVDLSVALKAVAGKVDQGGGPVWRYQNADNYFVARLNPLEGDFRLFKVVGGARHQIGKTVPVGEPAGKWHTIRIVQRGPSIQCSLNGNLLIEAQDESLRESGKIGLWTKADAVTYFDNLTASNPSASSPSPTRVFVVNTLDASVSLVDLATMQEVKRIPVGERPYGIAVTRDGQTLAVGVEDEKKVKFFDTGDYQLKGETHIGKMFNDHIVLTQDGTQIMVANFYSDDVVCIDVATMKEAYRIEGCSAPHVVKYGPLKKNLYVTCKKITGIAIVDPVDHALVKFHPLNVNPRSLTFSPDESKIYFGPFWVNGVFEMDAATGKITRLMEIAPPVANAAPQEVTYHGVEAIGPTTILAANEGRSYVDAIDAVSGTLLDRLTDVVKPCCIERIPSSVGSPTRVLISNLGDGTLQLVEVSVDGKMKSLGKAVVGAAPKRVAFLPPLSAR